MVKIDENLIREIETLTNWLNVHKARGIAQGYYSHYSICEWLDKNLLEKDRAGKTKEEWEEDFQKSETRLRKFISAAKLSEYKRLKQVIDNGEIG